MRKLSLILLAILAARLAKRALSRGAGPYADIMAALCQLISLIAADLHVPPVNSAKVRGIEDRLNLLVPRIPVPQNAPGTTAGGASSGSNTSFSASNSSFSTSNGSYSMGVINSTANSGSGNQGGGPGSNTSGQVGGAAAHTHDMTHYHTSSADLEGVFNALQGTMSNLVPAFNTLQGSHSSLVPAVNALQVSHSALVTTVNNLVSDHAQLITDHNNLKNVLISSGILK